MLIPSSRARKCRRKRNHFVLVEAHHSVRWSFEHSLLYEFALSFTQEFVRRRIFTNSPSSSSLHEFSFSIIFAVAIESSTSTIVGSMYFYRVSIYLSPAIARNTEIA